MNAKDSLGDRMKQNYEKPYSIVLPSRMPLIIRVDGKNFHTILRKAQRPYDIAVSIAMRRVAQRLVANISGAVFAYSQSDEVSVLVHNYKRLKTSPWFSNELQKMVSVAASEATVEFNKHYLGTLDATFDARAFVLPEAEVANYFIWRQKDAERNSIQMLARSLYSHKELHLKKRDELHELIHAAGKNWNDVETFWKRGFAVYRVGENRDIIPDVAIPIFTQDRNYIEQFLVVEEG